MSEYGEPVLIGYAPKRFAAAGGDPRAPKFLGVEEICCVTECSGGTPPAGWVDHWKHNAETWLFDTPKAAWSVVPDAAAEGERYRLYAYRLLPTLFHESGRETEHPLPKALAAAPIPAGFSRIGYDAVQRCVGAMHEGGNHAPGFGCSPLACNGMAPQYPVNRCCLIDDLQTAVAMARDFAAGNCEPGPYCVVEVWRREHR